MSKGLLRPRVAAAMVAAFFAAGIYQATPAFAATAVTTPQELEAALGHLTPAQDAELARILSTVLEDAQFSRVFSTFAASASSPLGFSLDELLGGASPISLDGLVNGLGLLPAVLRYEWQTTVGGTTKVHPGILNVPSLLDVDGQAGPDVIATLSLNGTTGVTLSVDKLSTLGGLGLLAPAAIPLKIEAIVPDPRGGTAKFAFGYDTRTSNAPTTYSESVTISGTGATTQVAVNISQSGAGAAMSLLASQFSGDNLNRINDQTLAVQLAPVPATVSASAAVGSGSVAVNLGASTATVATVDYVDYGGTEPQSVNARIDRLPTNLGIQVSQGAGGTQLNYAASAAVSRITAWADNLAGFGAADLLTLTLGNVPTNMTLTLAGTGDRFDLDTRGVDLGLLEAVLTSGPIENVPAAYDGVLLKNVPGTSLIAARITGLRRVTGDQSPLSIFLDSTAGRAFRVELREKPSATAKETYTLAELSSLARSTSVSISDGAQQRINYGAAAATGSLSFSTNSGARQSMTASVAPVPASIAICAAGNNGCSASGKPGNTASMRVEASQHMTVNLLDCKNVGCGEQLRLTDVSVRLADMTVDVGQSCNFLGCLPNGSRGSIWLDTDGHTLRGTLRSASSSFTVQAGFGNGFWANNRYVTWDYFIPSKSGSISCTSGTYLDVTVFGITIDVSGLYLC